MSPKLKETLTDIAFKVLALVIFFIVCAGIVAVQVAFKYHTEKAWLAVKFCFGVLGIAAVWTWVFSMAFKTGEKA